LLIAISPFDSRTVLGISPWIKPMKFSISIAIFVWTLAWYLRYLEQYQRPVRIINGGVALCVLAEIFCITLQAGRGTTSHYNVATAFDATVFTIMGVMIGINTLLVAWTLVLFFIAEPAIARSYLWGIRFGLTVFLLASAEGIFMIHHGSHTVGAPDGGPGLPFVNWSREHGDLRIAHFAGMHALQILPFAGYIAGRIQLPESVRLAYVAVAGVLYAGLVLVIAVLAWLGRPLMAL